MEVPPVFVGKYVNEAVRDCYTLCGNGSLTLTESQAKKLALLNFTDSDTQRNKSREEEILQKRYDHYAQQPKRREETEQQLFKVF
jgi:hypothetical protein